MVFKKEEIEKLKELLEKKAGLKDFLPEDFIGEGSFGKVVRAKLKNNPAKDLDYALKVILVDKDNASGVAEKKFIENLYGKIKKCCPACVVNIYPSFLREGFVGSFWKELYYLVIVADYVPQTLANFKGSPKEVLKIGVRLGECLLQFLKKGLIYTDLKPQNVGISPDLHPLILDLGGFKDLERVVKLSLTLSKSSVKLFTPLYSPPEFINALHLGKAGSYFEKELIERKGTTYQLAATLIEPLTGLSFDPTIHEGIYSLTFQIEDLPLRELFQKALSQNREERPTLEEFLKDLQKKLYSLSFSAVGEAKAIVVLKDLKVKASQNVELKDKIYIVAKDIEIEPKGELIIKNATLLFEEGAGIVGKDCTFIAENSLFKPLKESWKNITLGGHLKGYIKGCTFKGGKGRRGEEINKLLGVELWESQTYGGALFIRAKEKFRIESCNFENCSAFGGGGVRVGNTTVENCFFENCSAEFGGGVRSIDQTVIKNCTFKTCSAEESGGAIYCFLSSSLLSRNTFINCKPNNVEGECKTLPL